MVASIPQLHRNKTEEEEEQADSTKEAVAYARYGKE